jgi:hypothetical protein
MMSLRQRLRCRKFFASCLLLQCLASPLPSLALTPQLSELQRLDFGILAVTTNAAVSSVVLAPQGTASYDPAFVFIAAATPGRYRLTGYPPTNVQAMRNLPPDLKKLALTDEQVASFGKIQRTFDYMAMFAYRDQIRDRWNKEVLGS